MDPKKQKAVARSAGKLAKAFDRLLTKMTKHTERLSKSKEKEEAAIDQFLKALEDLQTDATSIANILAGIKKTKAAEEPEVSRKKAHSTDAPAKKVKKLKKKKRIVRDDD